jgi:hypothetical protein
MHARVVVCVHAVSVVGRCVCLTVGSVAIVQVVVAAGAVVQVV